MLLAPAPLLPTATAAMAARLVCPSPAPSRQALSGSTPPRPRWSGRGAGPSLARALGGAGPGGRAPGLPRELFATARGRHRLVAVASSVSTVSSEAAALEASAPPIPGFTVRTFTSGGVARLVYSRGAGAGRPGVIILHELPGLTPTGAEFATRLADAGYWVECPVLFGTPGKPLTLPYFVASAFDAICVRKEFAWLATGATSPITDYLRALATDLHGRAGGAGVGVVGQCFTGGFALMMALEPCVRASVCSQPAGIRLSEADRQLLGERARAGSCAALGLRFTADFSVPPERFAELRALLGDSFDAFEIDSSKGNAHGFGPGDHAVLTRSFRDEPGHPTRVALDRVLGFLRRRLAAAPVA